MAALWSVLWLGALPCARAEECPPGPHTRLEISVLERPEALRHDHDVGRDRLTLKTRDGRELMHSDSHDFHWKCLSYSPQRGHVVGAVGERGAWFVLRSIGYLAEDAKMLEPSAFTVRGFLALAARTSPRGRFIAFIGGAGSADALYVLDTKLDKIKKLGPAPAPPPQESDFACEDSFDWGSCWVGGFVEIEPRVLRFEGESRLVVSYGKDGPRGRARKRTVRKYRL